MYMIYTHRRGARAFRALTVKAHFIVHSNSVGQSEAKRNETSRPGASNGQQFPCPAFDSSIIIDFWAAAPVGYICSSRAAAPVGDEVL